MSLYNVEQVNGMTTREAQDMINVWQKLDMSDKIPTVIASDTTNLETRRSMAFSRNLVSPKHVDSLNISR